MDNEPAYLLKMVQQTKHAEKCEGANGVKDVPHDYIGAGEDHSMSFEFKDVIDFAVEGAVISTEEKQQNGNYSSLSYGTRTNSLPRRYRRLPYRYRYLRQHGLSREGAQKMDTI